MLTETTVREMADSRGLKNYDTAIPQDWFDVAIKVSGLNPQGHIVWSYDRLKIWGGPEALTIEGEAIVGLMDDATGYFGAITIARSRLDAMIE